jgi:hypothetical protein
MSITLHTEPAEHTPAYNPVVFTFDSTNKNQAGFFYVVRARVNSSSSYTQWLIPASPTSYGNGVGKKDFSKFISAYLSSRFSVLPTSIVGMSDGIVRLRVTVGEKYGSGAISGDMVTGDAVFCYNAGLRYPEFAAYNENDYTLGTSTIAYRFLSKFPSTRSVASGEMAYLVAITKAINTAIRYRIKTYDDDGILNGDFYITYSDGATLPTPGSKMIQAPAGWNINDVATGDFTVLSGALPVLDSAVASYTIQWTNASNAIRSELMTFNVVERNCIHTPIQLIWVNRLGGIDTLTFDLVNRYSRENKTQQYSQPRGEWSGDDFVFNTDKPERVNYSAIEKTRYKLISDYLDQDNYNAMEDLMGSPYVLARIKNQFIAVQVTDTNFEQKLKVADQLFNLEVNIEFSQDTVRQSW